MSGGKFSKILTRPRSAIGTGGEVMATYEGGVGYRRDAKSELFLLAVTNMVSENTFYEQAEDRDRRFVQLLQTVTREDPLWVARFVPYLRNTMQMRSAAVVAAVEYGRAYAGAPEAAGRRWPPRR